MLAYKQWTKFRRDLRAGRIPAPTRKVGQVNLWSREEVEAFIDGAGLDSAKSADIAKILERVR